MWCKIINKKAFTLIELIVTIAIVAILATIGVPVLAGQISKSKQAELESYAKLIATQGQTLLNGAKVAGTVSSGNLVDGTAVTVATSLPKTNALVKRFCEEADIDTTDLTVAVDVSAVPFGAPPPNTTGWTIDKVVLTKGGKTATWTRT